MPPRSWRLRIEDILDAIAKIEAYTRGMTCESFAGDSKTVDAVVRNLEIIGEAASRVDPMVMAGNPDVPWAKMKQMRNIVAHEYFGVDLEIVWATVESALSPLVPALRRILDRS